MNPDPNQKRDEALLDAMLGGEPWAEVNASVKRAALAEFHAGQRRRRVQQWAMAMAACAVFAGGAVWMTQRDTSSAKPKEVIADILNKTPTPINENPSSELAVTVAKPSAPTLADLAKLPQHISEEQMLALFPKGSCIIAEIDGQKQLIFFDRKIEDEGALYQPGS